MERKRIRETRFTHNLDALERLTVQTCPGYNEALDRALADTYSERKCRSCPLTVRIEGAIAREYIKGKCPKI